jgi:hypothetical protein
MGNVTNAVGLMAARIGSLSAAVVLLVVFVEMGLFAVLFGASWSATFHQAVARFDCADVRLRSWFAIIGTIVSSIVAGGALIMGSLFVGVTVTHWCVDHGRFVSEQTRRDATSVLFPVGSALFAHGIVTLGLRSRRIVAALVTLSHAREGSVPDSTD